MSLLYQLNQSNLKTDLENKVTAFGEDYGKLVIKYDVDPTQETEESLRTSSIQRLREAYSKIAEKHPSLQHVSNGLERFVQGYHNFRESKLGKGLVTGLKVAGVTTGIGALVIAAYVAIFQPTGAYADNANGAADNQKVEQPQVQQEAIPAMVFSSPPTIDGDIEEKWNTVYCSGIRPMFDDSTLEPYDDEPTISYVGYDNKNLYIAMVCFEKQENIIARFQKKKQVSKLGEDDYAGFTLSFDMNKLGDRKAQNSYKVNPYGAYNWQPAGGQVAKIEISVPPKVAIKIHDDRWIVEMEVPWNSMRYKESDEPYDIGLLLQRGHDGKLAQFPNTVPEAGQDWQLWFCRYQGWKPPAWNPFATVMPYVFAGISEEGLLKRVGVNIFYKPGSQTESLLVYKPDHYNFEQYLYGIEEQPDEILIGDGRPFFQFDNAGLGVSNTNFYSRRVGEFDFGGRFRTMLPKEIAASGLITYGKDTNSVARLQKDWDDHHLGLASINAFNTERRCDWFWLDGSTKYTFGKQSWIRLMADVAYSRYPDRDPETGKGHGSGSKYWAGAFFGKRWNNNNDYLGLNWQFLALEPTYYGPLGSHGNPGNYGIEFRIVKYKYWNTTKGEGENAKKVRNSLLVTPNFVIKKWYDGDIHRKFGEVYSELTLRPHMLWGLYQKGTLDKDENWRAYIGMNLNRDNDLFNLGATFQWGEYQGYPIKQFDIGSTIPCEGFYPNISLQLQKFPKPYPNVDNYKDLKINGVFGFKQDITEDTGVGGRIVASRNNLSGYTSLYKRGGRKIEYQLFIGDTLGDGNWKRAVFKILGAWSLDNVIDTLKSFRLGQPPQ